MILHVTACPSSHDAGRAVIPWRPPPGPCRRFGFGRGTGREREDLPCNGRCLLQQVFKAGSDVLPVQDGRRLAGLDLVEPVKRLCRLVRHRLEDLPYRWPMTGLARGGDVEDVPLPEMVTAMESLAGDYRLHRVQQQCPSLDGPLERGNIGARRRGNEIDLATLAEIHLDEQPAIPAVAEAGQSGLDIRDCCSDISNKRGVREEEIDVAAVPVADLQHHRGATAQRHSFQNVAIPVDLIDDYEGVGQHPLPGGDHHVASRGTSLREYAAKAFAVLSSAASGPPSSVAKIRCASRSISMKNPPSCGNSTSPVLSASANSSALRAAGRAR